MATGKWKHFYSLLVRRREIPPPQHESSNLRRCLNRWDLTSLGLGSTLGVGIYMLVGSVGLKVAGPSIVLSFLIAAVVSMFAGLCFAEFGARVPMAGSVYVYTYVTVGEFVAFINGWLIILEAFFGGASVARGLSLFVDSMADGAISNWSASVFPMHSEPGPVFSHYFDILSLLVTVCLGCLLAVGVRESSSVNNVFAVFNMLVIMFIVFAGVFKVDYNNWCIPASQVPEGFGVGGFFPYGWSGMLKGAALCFYGFVGFDVISFTGEEVHEPRRTIPHAIVMVLLIVMLSYSGVSTVVTMMVPYYTLDEAAAAATAFTDVDWDWARWIISAGAVCGICASLFASLFSIPRLLYPMALDGLLFHWFATTYRKTPVFATIVPAIIIGVLAATIKLEQLIMMMCVGTLVSFTIVASCVIWLRYRSHIESETHPSYIKQAVGCGDRSATAVSSRVVDVTLFMYVCVCSLSALAGVLTEWLLAPLLIFHVMMLLLLAVIAVQPQVKQELSFKTPLVPLIPCLSIYCNVHLMILVNLQTWLRVFIWILMGIPIYFLCLIFYKQRSSMQSSDTSFPHIDKNGKSPVQIIVEAPTPPDTIGKKRNHADDRADMQEKKQDKLDNFGKQAFRSEEIIVQQAFVENNEEKEAKIIDLLDQVLQAEEDSYVEQLSLREDEKSEQDDMVPIEIIETIPHRKSLSELSDAGSDASLGNQELSKYSVIAQVHREDMPKVDEDEEKIERDSDSTDNDVENIEKDEHEEVTAFNDSDTNSRTDESGYSDTIDKNNDPVEETVEEVPYIPPPPPFDENYFSSPFPFKKSYSIPRPNRQRSMEEEENKPRESVQSNSSQDDGNIVFGSNRQMKFMNKLNDIFQNKMNNEEIDDDQRRRSNSTGAMVDSTEFSHHALMRDRPSLFLDLKKELMSMNSVPNLRPVNTDKKEDNTDTSRTNEDESEDSSMSREDLKSKLENIFASGGPKALKPRVMKSNPPTPEEAYQTDNSSTESITKLPKMEKNDTLKRQKDKFSEVLNSFRLSLNKDDAV